MGEGQLSGAAIRGTIHGFGVSACGVLRLDAVCPPWSTRKGIASGRRDIPP